MPRSKPYKCSKCGTLYTGARCPKCYPHKKRRRRASTGSRRRRRASDVLSHSYGIEYRIPVNIDAIPEKTAAD